MIRNLPGSIENDFNLFTRCFRKLFRKERIHLLGMRLGNPQVLTGERG